MKKGKGGNNQKGKGHLLEYKKARVKVNRGLIRGKKLSNPRTVKGALIRYENMAQFIKGKGAFVE